MPICTSIHTYIYVCAYLKGRAQVVVMPTKNGNVPCKSTQEVYRVSLFGLAVGYYLLLFFFLLETEDTEFTGGIYFWKLMEMVIPDRTVIDPI